MINRRLRNIQPFCCEDISHIENYDLAVADKDHLWEVHHRNEICEANRSRLDKGITTAKQLIADGMYYNRPACELIFLRHDEHRKLHGSHRHYLSKEKFSQTMKGHSVSDKTKLKLSTSLTNRRDMSTPVEMTRISDGFTKVFPSQQEAARWLATHGYPNQRSGNISNCCMGRQKTTGGCTWRYV